MIRHAAHRDVVAPGQSQVEQSGGDLRILEKELVEVSEPKEQQGIGRHAGAQPLILLHHRSEGMSHDGRMKLKEEECESLIFAGNKKPSTLFPKCWA